MSKLSDVGTHQLHTAEFRSRRLITAASVLLLTLTGASLHAASITALGDLPGARFGSLATAVAADGSAVVGSSVSANGYEAFRWTSNGGMVGLGDLPGGEFSSDVRGVSADGSVVVGIGKSANGTEAFRWTSSGGMVGMGFLPGEYSYSFATDVSVDGSVVVGGSSSSNGTEAFHWTNNSILVGLGDLPGGEFFSQALTVSADGSVVVGFGSSTNGEEAIRWTAGGGMVGLGDFPGGEYWSRANDVSADGTVVVGFGHSATGKEVFRWTNEDGMLNLGKLLGSDESEALGVSADGSIVVGFSSVGYGWGREDAFLWTQSRGMQSLWDALLSKGVSPAASGWTALTWASDISDDGRYVVGSGLRNGKGEAFLVDLQGNGDDSPVISNLEIPADGSDQAGIGIVSGWHCTASVITVQFDDLAPITAGSKTTRADTASICGDANNGFSLLWAYSLLGEGQHTAVLYADGVEFARSQFNVTLVNGEAFVEGASGAWELPDFPTPGNRLKVKWDEASQNFVIFGSEAME